MPEYCVTCGARVDECEVADGFSYGCNGIVIEHKGQPQVALTHPRLLRELAKFLCERGYLDDANAQD